MATTERPAASLHAEHKGPCTTETDHGKGTPRPGSEIEKTRAELKIGDRVEYHPVEGSMQTTTGTIEDIETCPVDIGGRHVRASPEEPRYFIKNDHTQKTTAYFKKAIQRKLE
ncbi:uncharacterized protein SPPG_06788 [Spizellomyces punctatus DAOM BR117]|uniref:Hypervirulence associated protein TUDOR domain-containing protein n=1 Tax=Spizellomyces punctatus (strain DAOM BR117) TaxID=645134 RepID=A0A0L0HAP8_SPIPD|nr:uncharacterized protein SPPG_06788 [Spizellomyces punctatus DAOM BR117]KNC97793.1 hypothetical protein SPPG_06788 [Spizellomyces punctatus DAOM BR117]|eukprot:XP_016605833.1 hypothetical protein SPPG_06788 [Spizellomyces punctatus DAOM BR117]